MKPVIQQKHASVQIHYKYDFLAIITEGNTKKLLLRIICNTTK